MIIAYVLFFLAGLGFGYAAPSWTKILPVFFPLLLGAASFVKYGLDGEIVARLILALVLTIGGIVLGMLIAGGGRREATA
jgi:hypothetical protein